MIDFEKLRRQLENTLRIEYGYTLIDTRSLKYYIDYDEKLCRTLLIHVKRETKIPE